MKYTTSCPQCDTYFLLDDVLIKAYRGNVQCGSCQHVFNAKNRLTEIVDDITSTDQYQAAIVNISSEETISVSPEPVATAEVEKETAPNESKAALNNETDIDYIIGQSSSKTDLSEEKEEVTQAIPDFDGMKKKSRQHSFLSNFTVLLLLLILILQAVYLLRGKVASEYPWLKPTLERACRILKCTIDLPQNLDLISIGDSDMQEDDAYQSVINFTSSLQNNAKYSQAYPNIELTLTDSNNIPVIKKLVMPKNYLTSRKKIEQGIGPHEVVNIKLSLHVDDASVASYRILLRY